MTDEMTTITEFLPLTGETRQRPITKEDLEKLFEGMGAVHLGPSEHGGLYTHTIEFPEATDEERAKVREEAQRLEQSCRMFTGVDPAKPPNNPGTAPPDTTLTAVEFGEIYRQQMQSLYTPTEYRRQLLGVPSGAGFPDETEEIVVTNVTPKPNVWERLKTWVADANTQTVTVTRPQRQSYAEDYLAAICTAHRNTLTGAPRRGGMMAAAATAAIYEDQRRMLLQSFRIPNAAFGIPTRAMPSAEAEARWAEHVGIGARDA
jgi:hypothetical protein